jgi:3'-5' exoribonuclease
MSHDAIKDSEIENSLQSSMASDLGSSELTTSVSAVSSPTAGGAAPGNKICVVELQEKQTFTSFFLVREKALLTGKNGKTYLNITLSDKTGNVDGRIWDSVEALDAVFQAGDIVRVKGQVQIFQGRKQVIVHRLERAVPADFHLPDFLSASRRSPEEMLAEVLKIAGGIVDNNIRQLTLDVLHDPEIRVRLLKAPAAKSIHHAYAGGLLEHMLSICGMMRLLAAHYEQQQVRLKPDFLIFGAIFHDIGKIWELDISAGITYSDKGKLLGHMMMAIELIEKKASRILGFSEETKDLLKHIILSHHGRLEYGSPKTPMFIEAMIVAAVDDLDSKINTIHGFVTAERESGEKWSRFNPMFERYFLLKY